MRLTVGLCAAWAATGQAAALAEPTVRSGPLQAHLSADPWQLELTGKKGEAVLSEHPGTGSGPSGTLGFRTALGWSHATQVKSSSVKDGVFSAELATTDPLGRTIHVKLSPSGGGVIALDARLVGSPAGVQAMGMGFGATTGERYLGFGERSNQVDQGGSEVENYVADGPYQDEEYTGIQAFVPPWGLRDRRPDTTYFPIPWLLSSEGYGVLVDNPETSTFRLGSDDSGAWSVEVTPAPPGEVGAELAPPVDRLQMRFFAGPEPADALRRFSKAVGRQPRAKAPWLYGPWFQPKTDAVDLNTLREADAPVSVFQTYTHYLPCGEQETERERARTQAAHDGGVAITTYFNPMVCANYDAQYGPAEAANALTETRAGTPYNYRYGANPDDLFVVGQYDFFEPAGRELYGDALSEAVGDGYDGWMEDFGEYTPLDSVSGELIDGTRAHNEYVRRYHCAAWDAIKDRKQAVVRFQRSGWTGAAKCAQVVWGGDPTTGWGFDGLRSAMTQALSAGTSGIGIWGSDIGGFFAIGFNKLTPELLTRWVQFGAVSGVMRTQRNGVALPPKDRPQVTDPDQIDNWRRYTKLRTQLYPYISAAEGEYVHSGLPLMRHLLLAYPDDAKAAAIEDEFLFGPDVLAAPVVDEGQTERTVYLPEGSWVDLWRSATYDSGSGGLELGEAQVLDGEGEATVPAPLSDLPLFVKAGAILPLLPPDVDTLAKPGTDEETVGLKDRRHRLDLLAFPTPGQSHAAFNKRGTIASRVTGRGWRLDLKAPKRTRFGMQAALGTIPGGLEPCSVKLNGRELPGSSWSYDPGTQVLDASFSGRRVTLEASASRCG